MNYCDSFLKKIQSCADIPSITLVTIFASTLWID